MNFLLIDDHPLFRLGFAALCQSLKKPAELTFATGFTEAVKIEAKIAFDLIFIDLELPDGSGLDLLPLLKNKFPLSPCIIMSAHSQPETIQSALKQGAQGFISKSEESNITTTAIELVLSGGMYIPQSAMNHPLNKTNNTSEQFTPKQLKILKCLAQGASNKKIAAQLFLSEGTVRNYVSNIITLLDVKNRSEAVAIARSKGILSSWD